MERISFCIPCHNRTHALKLVMPYLLTACRQSPPAEIAVVNYNSIDDCAEFISQYVNDQRVVYRLYNGREYYHMAHARNLSVLASRGDVVIIMSADIYVTEEFLPHVRCEFERFGYVWMRDEVYKGVLVIQREEFMAAGGFDERFEFYGSEDRELEERLVRRGQPNGIIPAGMVKIFRTSNEEKVQNYRLPLSKDEMHHAMKVYLDESRCQNTLVANPQGWGAWV